jgi:hypothetical protein
MQNDQDLVIQFQQTPQKETAFTQLLKKHQQRVFFQIKRTSYISPIMKKHKILLSKACFLIIPLVVMHHGSLRKETFYINTILN